VIGPRRWTLWGLSILALLLCGCATAADIKPGVVRGVDDSGFVKTTEGFGIVTSGCPDSQIWTVTLETATTFRPTRHVFSYGPLTILSADEPTGVIKAEDPSNFWRTGSFVGIFIHRLREDRPLIEVTSFWDTKSVVITNPWETDLLGAIRDRLPCVLPQAAAILGYVGPFTPPDRV
jgi:hypothetical protein